MISLNIFFCITLTLPVANIVHREDASDGKVTVVYQDGAVYRGRMMNGVKEGDGVLTRPDGAEFRGSFRNDRPNGRGIYVAPDGKMRDVTFANGKIIDSRWIHPTEVARECEYGSYELNGKYLGWYKKRNSRAYVPHGWGVMHYINGACYSGQWSDGRMHGNGKIEWSDGAYYIGQWRNGKRCGYGTYRWAGGEMYIGEWDDNRMCGRGIFFRRDGSVIGSMHATEPTVQDTP